MKNTTLLILIFALSLFTGKMMAQDMNEGDMVEIVSFDYEYNLADLDPVTNSVPELITGYFEESRPPWGLGEGLHGYRKQLFFNAYNNKKDLIYGKAVTPYFRIELETHFIEGQVFSHPVLGDYMLVRGKDGNFYVLSEDYFPMFSPGLFCYGLPVTDYETVRCASGVPYKTIDFSPMICSDKENISTLIAIYPYSDYNGCLDLQDLGICITKNIHTTLPE
jgi:hypothetical protein